MSYITIMNDPYNRTIVSAERKTKTTSQTNETSFSATIKSVGNGGLRASKVKTSTVDDFIRRRPDSKYQVERMVDAGKNVLSKYGSENVDEMSMDEYKEYIYGILDKIPIDSSQARDAQFIGDIGTVLCLLNFGFSLMLTLDFPRSKL